MVPTGAFPYLQFKGLEQEWEKIQESRIHGRLESLFDRLGSIAPVQNVLARGGDGGGGWGRREGTVDKRFAIGDVKSGMGAGGLQIAYAKSFRLLAQDESGR